MSMDKLMKLWQDKDKSNSGEVKSVKKKKGAHKDNKLIKVENWDQLADFIMLFIQYE